MPVSGRLPDRLDSGRPYPLGASCDEFGVNFAVFSANATLIDLCIFDPSGHKELCRLPLPECTHEIWHGFLPKAAPGLVYGFRAYGPYDPTHGHRFNPHKLLLDPYARQLITPLHWSEALFGYHLGHADADLVADCHDSAPAMPKAVVTDFSFNWDNHRKPCIPWEETVIYEAHLKGVSMLREEVPAPLRGTFAALSHPRFIDHLHELGITAIELLPVHAFLQDAFLINRGLRNYWGYNTLSYFAPEPAYLSTGDLQEFCYAIQQLHAAGIEVILDVVYNHTCEGNELGPTLSWRGLDNASYYRLVPGNERYYLNDTGCGNALNLSHQRVLQMVLDSLRYWATTYQIDGFRFDLSVTLGRTAAGFSPNASFFDAILQDPILSQCKLIAEPWDLGPYGYQLGNHPPGFAEWNDKFRDTVRRFWRGDAGQRRDLAERLTGSRDIFNHRRCAWASVNFVAIHDGFTTRDIVSYNNKHNEANGEDGRDGSFDNSSRNWGVEGPTSDPQIEASRNRVQRALLTTVLLADGTPMLLAGDEFGRSQQGNNNAYCQDNPVSWLDWQKADTEQGQQLTRFLTRVASCRRQHASLWQTRCYQDAQKEVLPSIPGITWFDIDGRPMADAAWPQSEGRALGLRRACTTAAGLDVTLTLVNGSAQDIVFALPEGMTWRLLLQVAEPEAAEVIINAPNFTLKAHDLALFSGHLLSSS
jgi:glycogen operon protein